MERQTLFLWTVSIVSGAAAYFAYERSTFLSAILVLVSVSWILYNFRSKMSVWNSLSTLKNPVLAPLTFFMLGFIYSSFEGFSFTNSLVFSLGTGVLGGALGMLFYKYWNIGS